MVRKVFVSHCDWDVPTKFVSYSDSMFVNAISCVEEMTIKNFDKYNNAILRFFYIRSLKNKKEIIDNGNNQNGNIDGNNDNGNGKIIHENYDSWYSEDDQICEYYENANEHYKKINKKNIPTIEEKKSLCSMIANCLNVNKKD